jgi:hypothetical protein
MTNSEIISLGINIGVFDETVTDFELQYILFTHYMERMAVMGLLSSSGGEYEISDTGKAVIEFLVSNEYTLNADDLKMFMMNDVEQYVQLIPVIDAFVESIILLHTDGEDVLINRLIDLGARRDPDEIDALIEMHSEMVEQVKTKYNITE